MSSGLFNVYPYCTNFCLALSALLKTLKSDCEHSTSSLTYHYIFALFNIFHSALIFYHLPFLAPLRLASFLYHRRLAMPSTPSDAPISAPPSPNYSKPIPTSDHPAPSTLSTLTEGPREETKDDWKNEFQPGSGAPERISESLARQLSKASADSGSVATLTNPFQNCDDPALEPGSAKFNARHWAETYMKLISQDPEKYLPRSAGFTFAI